MDIILSSLFSYWYTLIVFSEIEIMSETGQLGNWSFVEPFSDSKYWILILNDMDLADIIWSWHLISLYLLAANLLIFIHNLLVKKLEYSPLSVDDVDKWVSETKSHYFCFYITQNSSQKNRLKNDKGNFSMFCNDFLKS